MTVPYRQLDSLVERGIIRQNHKTVVEILLKRKWINVTHLGAHVSPIVEEVVGHHANRGVINVSKVTIPELMLLASEIKDRGTSH
ncbi:MAG: hypothetical protein V1717_02950 [Candidatus Micrarchaeota archaeon]